MSARLAAMVILALFVVFLISAACTSGARFRVLNFFFDGVPAPGSAAGSTLTTGPSTPALSIGPVTPAPSAIGVRSYAHAPYRENRCASCHDLTSGRLVRPLEEGLCLTCHGQLVSSLRYVHGPVAVHACTQCHAYHTASNPQLLLMEPGDTCATCHSPDDLSTMEAHAHRDGQSCVACHNPHGGGDRFFLKRSEP